MGDRLIPREAGSSRLAPGTVAAAGINSDRLSHSPSLFSLSLSPPSPLILPPLRIRPRAISILQEHRAHNHTRHSLGIYSCADCGETNGGGASPSSLAGVNRFREDRAYGSAADARAREILQRIWKRKREEEEERKGGKGDAPEMRRDSKIRRFGLTSLTRAAGGRDSRRASTDDTICSKSDKVSSRPSYPTVLGFVVCCSDGESFHPPLSSGRREK